MKQFAVISYDISNDKRRLKVMQALEDYGRRVQYSVFECRLRPKELERLKRRLRPLVEEEDGDSVRFYFLCIDDILRTEILGFGTITKDRNFYMQ